MRRTNYVYLAMCDHLIGQLLGKAYTGGQFELYRNLVLIHVAFLMLAETRASLRKLVMCCKLKW